MWNSVMFELWGTIVYEWTWYPVSRIFGLFHFSHLKFISYKLRFNHMHKINHTPGHRYKWWHSLIQSKINFHFMWVSLKLKSLKLKKKQRPQSAVEARVPLLRHHKKKKLWLIYRPFSITFVYWRFDVKSHGWKITNFQSGRQPGPRTQSTIHSPSPSQILFRFYFWLLFEIKPKSRTCTNPND